LNICLPRTFQKLHFRLIFFTEQPKKIENGELKMKKCRTATTTTAATIATIAAAAATTTVEQGNA
jgi:hypothetical protein